MNLRLLCLVVALVLVGCKKERAEQPPPRPRIVTPPAVPASWYRAALQGPDGELVFLLGLPAVGGGQAVLQSGLDRVERPATWDGTNLRIEFPVYQTVVVATRQADETLRGAFESRSRSFGESSLPLTATPIAKPELSALGTVKDGAPIDLGAPYTLWKITMVEEGTARLELAQIAPGDFHGTVTFANGNHSFLAGNGKGDRIVLTSFDGAAASRFTLELAPDRATGTGEWLTGQKLDWREKLTAERTPGVNLVSTQPSPRGSKIELPQLAGLEGKPVIVELAGSWCSSCKNAAPVLRDLHDEFGSKGLRIVTLLYEFTDDPVANREQAEIFKKTYDIPWKVVAVPGAPEDLADTLPKGFEKVAISGFPVALFLKADRTLVGVHAGFPVAGSPNHQEAVDEYRRNVALIIDGK